MVMFNEERHVPEENIKTEKWNTEEEINQRSTGKAKALEELISVTKEINACQIEKCDIGKQSVIRNKR